MRVALVDPPAYTPPYDHALAAALARSGADVSLLTSRFRYGTTPRATVYEVRELFYPLSSRVGRTAARLALRAVEHPYGLLRLALTRADVVHLQWSGAPELDAFFLHTTVPLVFTAHDILPRRTASRQRLWRRLFDRFDRVVVHSDNGRSRLEEYGVEAAKLRVIPHPVFASNPARLDDGRTVLALGVIRPYKGLADAVESVLRVESARLLVAGDPRIPLNGLSRQAGARAEWRLGYLTEREIERALGEATVAVFPYREGRDQSGALLLALGAGVPAVVYDVGGLAEPVRAFGAGKVVPAGDSDALSAAISELLADEGALAAAREGADRARRTLTWDAAAAAHLAVYRELA
jgi:glycosyltransferase involved in cell wall biosynthesis